MDGQPSHQRRVNLLEGSFTVTPAQPRAWHRREAEACVKEQNPAAALFHTLYGVDPVWALPTGLPRP